MNKDQAYMKAFEVALRNSAYLEGMSAVQILRIVRMYAELLMAEALNLDIKQLSPTTWAQNSGDAATVDFQDKPILRLTQPPHHD